jgi:RNA polymerase sigma-70 factor (ECF subfamily)
MSSHDRPADLEQLLRHSAWLAALARRLVADAAAADDLVQETWVAALCNPPDPRRPSRPWLAGVLRNLARLRSRRDARRADFDLAREAPAAADVPQRVELERRLASEVLALDEPYRSVIVLRYNEGLSAARIARIQGVPAATVRTRASRALARLRASLAGETGDDRTGLPSVAGLTAGRGAVDAGTLLVRALASQVALVTATGSIVVLAALQPWDARARGRSMAAAASQAAGPIARVGERSSLQDPATTNRDRVAQDSVRTEQTRAAPSSTGLPAELRLRQALAHLEPRRLRLEKWTPEWLDLMVLELTLQCRLGFGDPELEESARRSMWILDLELGPDFQEVERLATPRRLLWLRAWLG